MSIILILLVDVLILLGESEEKDLQVGSQPQSHQEEYHNKGSEDHRYPYNSWKTHSEEENVEYSKKVKEFGKPKYHSKSMNEPTDSEEYEQPVYQKVVTKKLETPTKHVEVETKGPVMPVEKVTDKQKEMQSPTQKDVDDADAELEMKLEELTPSSEKPPHVKVTPPTTFHHWREFVDNNPNFPYTIPVNPKKTTLKPTEKQHEQPRTEHHTTEKATTRKIVRTEPHKTTERTTTTENPKPHEDKVQGMYALWAALTVYVYYTVGGLSFPPTLLDYPGVSQVWTESPSHSCQASNLLVKRDFVLQLYFP